MPAATDTEDGTKRGLYIDRPVTIKGPGNDGPAQRVTREEALAMWTREAGRVLQWDGSGTLAPGSHADLIVVDRDPLTCRVEELPGTRADKSF